jgi:hypothetical protein
MNDDIQALADLVQQRLVIDDRAPLTPHRVAEALRTSHPVGDATVVAVFEELQKTQYVPATPDPLDLRHQERSSAMHIGEMFYYRYRDVYSLRVNELNSSPHYNFKGHYSVQIWLPEDGWTTVITDVEADEPRGAANIALDVLGALS